MSWLLEYTPLEVDEEVLAMLGKQSDLAGGEHPYLDHVRRDSFYGFLASHREELFSDEDFTDLYCPDNGRPSVSPSLLARELAVGASCSEPEQWARERGLGRYVG